jgi:hypothetical protein
LDIHRHPDSRLKGSEPSGPGDRPKIGKVKAIVQRELGGPEVLRVCEVETPEPIPTEVQVRVRAAGKIVLRVP